MDAKNILIAVDASENARRAVEYVAQTVAGAPGFRVTLLTIERIPDRDRYPDEAAWKRGCEEVRSGMEGLLAGCRSILEAAGLPPADLGERVLVSCRSPLEDKAESCSLGASIAEEILEVVKEGGYGTLVVGRRGLSRAEEFLFGSVSSKLIHHVKGATVWVVA